MSKHEWTYKFVEQGFWVVCASHGESDHTYATENEAKRRARYLSEGPKSEALRRLFPRRAF